MRKAVLCLGLVAAVLLLVAGCTTVSYEAPVPQAVAVLPEPAAVGTVWIAVEPEEITTAPEREYDVGERGPAGGIIFFNRTSFSEGWRYLEMAPEETEGNWMKWGPFGVHIEDTFIDLGVGKENTERIVSAFGNQREIYPALYCDQLVYGGYDDWYLPSKEELVLIYDNLIEPRAGDFPEEADEVKSYWSSTEDISGYIFYLIGQSGEDSLTTRDISGVFTRAVRRF